MNVSHNRTNNNGAVVLDDIDCPDYDVRMKPEAGLLRYIVIGQRNLRASYNLWKKIYQDCDKYQVNRVHATVLLNGQLDKMEIPLLIHKLIELNDARPITCAWVDHNSHSYMDNLIGEKIPRPEKMNIRIFNNDQEAVEWLAKSD